MRILDPYFEVPRSTPCYLQGCLLKLSLSGVYNMFHMELYTVLRASGGLILSGEDLHCSTVQGRSGLLGCFKVLQGFLKGLYEGSIRV